MRKSVTLSTRAAEACLLLAAALSLSPAALGMDRVRAESNIDAAVAKYGVTGRGVIVALLDRGIDWTNSDFRNADGTTRIAAIFDLTDPTGANAPGNTYGRARSTRGSRSTRRSPVARLWPRETPSATAR